MQDRLDAGVQDREKSNSRKAESINGQMPAWEAQPEPKDTPRTCRKGQCGPSSKGLEEPPLCLQWSEGSVELQERWSFLRSKKEGPADSGNLEFRVLAESREYAEMASGIRVQEIRSLHARLKNTGLPVFNVYLGFPWSRGAYCDKTAWRRKSLVFPVSGPSVKG